MRVSGRKDGNALRSFMHADANPGEASVSCRVVLARASYYSRNLTGRSPTIPIRDIGGSIALLYPFGFGAVLLQFVLVWRSTLSATSRVADKKLKSIGGQHSSSTAR